MVITSFPRCCLPASDELGSAEETTSSDLFFTRLIFTSCSLCLVAFVVAVPHTKTLYVR
jgi:hypothetical protein